MTSDRPAHAGGDPLQAARAIDALRRGWTIRVAGRNGALTVSTIERMNGPGAAERIADTTGILLSPSRAATLKLINQKDAADTGEPVLIAPPSGLDGPLAMAIADPVRDLNWPMKGPFRALTLEANEAGAAALELARIAGLLPAFFRWPDDAPCEAEVEAGDIAAFGRGEKLKISARAPLPLSHAENTEIVAFRTEADASEHVALIVGDRDASEPVVRLHSECLTGDIFGSLKCDCGPQLHEALARMEQASWGVLLYLRQEGRGIGLINKLRAYQLQAQGFDTVEANLRLGFAIDARQFSIAAEMLRQLGVDRLKLLTNNPDKVTGLEAEGLMVIERLPLAIAANPHNARYLDTKRDRTGHQL